MSKQTSVTAWLKSADRGPALRCYTCSNSEVAQAIIEFAKAKRQGETLSWQRFLDQFLIPVLKYEHSYEALMNHYRNHVRGKTDV